MIMLCFSYIALTQSSAKIKLASVHFSIDDTINAINEWQQMACSRYATPALQLIIDRIVKELINPVYGSHISTVETQTVPDRVHLRNAQQLHAPSQRYQRFYDPPDDRWIDGGRRASRQDLRASRAAAVGRADLDPTGASAAAGGGGMLFQPPVAYPEVLPDNRPSGVLGEPRARFDPFGPPGPSNTGRPNNDHFPPPGFDDQFIE